jgi:DNA repair protein RadA/Sms
LSQRKASNPILAQTPVLLTGVAMADALHRPSGIAEFDRVLGGGLMAGALILLGGDPGIGKSTLALQLAHHIGSGERPTLYCAGEESAPQLAARAKRCGCALDHISVLSETNLDVIISTIGQERPQLAIVDSVQTLFDPTIPGMPGSVSQVREAVGRLLLTAKQTDVTIVVIGHVTKDGAIAGPKTLEHMVDVVLYLEGERHGEYRILRGIKNRFGPSGEVGLFVMAAAGMVQLTNPGRAFIEEAILGSPGSCLTVLCEGSRPLAVEVQALTVSTAYGLPRRTASGFELGRLHVLLAVLEKRADIKLSDKDVYVNVVGGVKLSEPFADLAVALAIASAAKDKPLPPLMAFGEIGLGGEVRRVTRLDTRLQEAATLGVEAVAIPSSQSSKKVGFTVHGVATLGEAVSKLLR